MKKTLAKDENLLCEKAIYFLIDEYQKSGHNPKPVVLHSLRTAFYLIENGYNSNVFVGAILHDLIEDSNVTKKDIEENFGKDVSSLVASLSFNPDIENKIDRYMEAFKRLFNRGKDAIVIKCADIYNNSFYYELADKETQNYLLNKTKYFLDISKKEIGNEKVWTDLNKQFKSIKNYS